jgi:hypothetical protein
MGNKEKRNKIDIIFDILVYTMFVIVFIMFVIDLFMLVEK